MAKQPKLSISTTQLSSIRETFKLVKDRTDIIDLCIGDPQLPPPPIVVETLQGDLPYRFNNYENDAGRNRLRQIVAEAESKRTGLTLDPYENIVITNGATNGIYSFSRSILDSGDEVLLIDPVWIAFVKIIRLLNSKPVFVHSSSENSFVPEISDLQRSVSPRTKALVVISPGNPTGAVYSGEAMKMLSEFCQKNGLWLLHDEAYQDIVFDARGRTEILSHGPHVVGFRTLSKSHNLTGFRVGWVVSQNPAIIARVRRNVAFNVMCVSTLSQILAEVVLLHAKEWLENNIESYRARAYLGYERFSAMGMQVHRPEGGLYLFPKHMLDGPVAEAILRETGTAVIDGHHFGPSGAGHLRASICVEDRIFEKGLDRIEEWVAKRRRLN